MCNRFRCFRLLQRFWIAIALGLIIAAQGSGPAAAQQQTIDDIIKKGTIVVGVSTTTPIFGLVGSDGQPEGYDPDVARLLAKYLGVKVEFVPVTGANRIPQLLSGRVDVLICLFGITQSVRNRFGTQCPTLTKPRPWLHPRP